MATRDSAQRDDNRNQSAPSAGAEGTAARKALRPSARALGAYGSTAAARKSTDGARSNSRAASDPNSIRPTKRRAPAVPTRPPGHVLGRQNGGSDPDVTKGAAAPPAVRQTPAPRLTAEVSNDAVPEDMRRRFVQVGRTYYFPDGTRAFTDRGKRLTTPSENTEVIRSLVTIALARGWHDITVTGTERFRKEAWFAAKLAGLDVRGYKASDFDHEQLVRQMDRQNGTPSDVAGVAPGSPGTGARAASRATIADGGARTPATERRGGLIVGRLADHGPATYQHQPGEPMSYFAKLETERGERTIWGVDLERAFKESLTKPQPGEEIGLRAVRQDLVTVKARERDADGRVLGERDLATHRNRWIVEKRAFFEERKAAARVLRDPTVEPKRAVQEHPALIGTYMNLHAAELAAKQFRDPEDQKRFVGIIRNALADVVARGEPLPPVRLRGSTTPERRAARSPRLSERDRASVRG